MRENLYARKYKNPGVGYYYVIFLKSNDGKRYNKDRER